jgi:site-specific recombinase XerD
VSKVYCQIRNNRIDSKGECAVQIRAGNKTITLPFKIKPEDWNRKNGLVNSSNPNYRRYNTIILTKLKNIEEKIEAGESITEEKKIALIDYCNKFIKNCERTQNRGPETIRQYKSEVNKIKLFRAASILQKINHKWFDDYIAYWIKEGNSANTIWKSFKFIKLIINQALVDRLLKENPIIGYKKPVFTQPVRDYLKAEEVIKIEQLFTGSGAVDKAARLFLFSCYTGLRFTDIITIVGADKMPLKDKRLVVVTHKTKEPVSLVYEGKIKELGQQILKDKMIAGNYHINRVLKEVSSVIGISFNLTFHIARHTFAMRLADMGKDISLVAALLGHKNIRTTTIYYKISNKRIDDEMQDFGY